MTKTRKALVNDEWIVVVLGLIVLALCVLFPSAMNSLKIPGILASQSASALGDWQGWLGAVYIFLFVLALLYLSSALTGKPFKGIFLSFLVICLLTVISLALATIPFCKKYGLEAVLFAVILGLIISNFFKIPEWLKPAIQSEFYIKIGIVCLGATVLYQEVLKSGAYGLAQALIVVLCVWYFGFWVARKVFKVDDEMSTMLASSVSICGVSAAIATCGTIKGDQKKLSYVISLVMVVAIPMLYIMPLLCNWLLPLFFPGNELAQAQVAGAWIGGTIDTTAAVAASGGILGDEAGQTAVIVKASQNVLIGVAAFLISLFWSLRGTKGVEKTSGKVIWERFPKFVVGMVVASIVFSLFFAGSSPEGIAYKGLAKNFQNIFFSIAFVCIGLETNFKQIFAKENNQSLKAFLTAQGFNILFTLLVASLLFGVIKN